MKLIAAIRKKLPSTRHEEQQRNSRATPGPCTGNTNATTIAVGSVSRPRRNADSPIARQIHIHWIGDGLDQVHRDLAFDHFVGHFLVDRVPVERANDPADADVGDDLREIVAAMD